MENHTNSAEQFQRFKRELETEDREVKSLEDALRRKEIDHKRAKEAFEKIDKEMADLKKKKDELVHRRTGLETEMKNAQRSLDDLKRRGSTPLKF